ncbi:hypothetical protein NRF20_41930 [Streptomyces sp. R-74717]|uniref:hypothetical protein n=1 Tax=Streptomyces TaxID=1883 RepID=UPI0037A947F0
MSHPSPAIEATASAPKPRVDRRLASSLGLAQFGGFLVWGSVPTVLLARHLEDIDPRPARLGAFSDRTRSRLGKRAPYLLAGAFIGALALLATAMADAVLTISVAW